MTEHDYVRPDFRYVLRDGLHRMQLQSIQYSQHQRGFRYRHVWYELVVHFEEYVEILRRQNQLQVRAVI